MEKDKEKKETQERPIMDDVDEIGQGSFSNIINISGSPKEVFIDFGIAFPDKPNSEKPKINLVSRIILSKDHALEFKDVLVKMLKQYEN